jgi:small subunit ribosomal protein S12
LQENPQKRGICLQVLTRTPRKPNSALRKVVWIRLSNRRRVLAYVPGQVRPAGSGKQDVERYNQLLMRGGRVKDLPGVKYHLVRGKLDLMGVFNRKTSRSKYGVPRL